MSRSRFIIAAWSDPDPPLPYRVQRWHEVGIVEDEIKISPAIHFANGLVRRSSDPHWVGSWLEATRDYQTRKDARSAANWATWTQIESARRQYEKEEALSEERVATFQADKAYHWLGLSIKDHRVTRENRPARAQWMAMMKGEP